jgi:hypothetical protein
MQSAGKQGALDELRRLADSGSTTAADDFAELTAE